MPSPNDNPTDRWLVAIGGNALADPRDPADLARQGDKAAAIAPHLASILEGGRGLIIVHGNGPQVGGRLIQNELAAASVPPSPLFACVAETQGQMGHYLALALSSELRRRGLQVPVVALVTHVIVDPNAPEFRRPEKPVGPVYGETEARRLAHERSWALARVPGGWRRVVPSPRPLAVVEEPAIRQLLQTGAAVIAGGGGGIPLVADGPALRGVDAVVDKDYVAQLLATACGCSRLIVLTDVPGAALSFESSPQYLRQITVAEAKVHLAAGEFAAGSMGPKVEACIGFLEDGGQEATIAATFEAGAAIAGQTGTRIIPGP